MPQAGNLFQMWQGATKHIGKQGEYAQRYAPNNLIAETNRWVQKRFPVFGKTQMCSVLAIPEVGERHPIRLSHFVIERELRTRFAQVINTWKEI